MKSGAIFMGFLKFHFVLLEGKDIYIGPNFLEHEAFLSYKNENLPLHVLKVES